MKNKSVFNEQLEAACVLLSAGVPKSEISSFLSVRRDLADEFVSCADAYRLTVEALRSSLFDVFSCAFNYKCGDVCANVPSDVSADVEVSDPSPVEAVVSGKPEDVSDTSNADGVSCDDIIYSYLCGQVESSEPTPSIAKIMRELNVTRGSVDGAFRRLERSGRIVVNTVRGRGRFLTITELGRTSEPPPGYARPGAGRPRKTPIQVDEPGVRPPDGQEVKVRPDARVVRVECARGSRSLAADLPRKSPTGYSQGEGVDPAPSPSAPAPSPAEASSSETAGGHASEHVGRLRCQFIVGDLSRSVIRQRWAMEDKDSIFCKEYAVDGKPYCDEHVKVCYVSQARKETANRKVGKISRLSS